MKIKIHNKKSLYVFSLIVLALFVIMVCRLFAMQVVKADEYTTLSEKNTIRIISIPASRGDIFDREMAELAVSKPVFAVALASSEIKDREKLSQDLAAALKDPEITADSIEKTLKEHYRRYEPVVIKRYAYEEGLTMISKLEEMRDLLPGVVILEEPMRYYPQGETAGHLLGTVGMISSDELSDLSEYGYTITDWIGKSGVEKTMERFTVADKEIGLRGKNGMNQVEVNANHRTVRTLSTQEPQAGNSLVLTLDLDLQKVMEQSLADTVIELQRTYPKCRAAAAVMLDVKTGGILAMASYPTINPNDFSQGLTSAQAKYYFDEALRPTFNRVIAGAYPPGSTFKIATATAILDSGIIDPYATVTCNSSMWKKPRAKCPKAHGTVDLEKALAVSCNAYFQEMGKRIGIEQLAATAQGLGFGQTTGIELPGEVAGVLPNPAWKAERFSGKEGTWKTYDTYYMSMGQGYNNYTVLQLANAVATIANGGNRMQLHLVDQILDNLGTQLYQYQPTILNTMDISSDKLQIVRDAMLAVTQQGGTSYGLFADFPIQVGAKTGTAQTGLPGDDKGKDYHGVFVSFAPFDDPQVAFACLIEYGYHGGSSGGVVCKEVYKEYFGLNEQPVPDDLPDAPE
ncbi:MAG: penicillin-binding protein 2 [Bacillota bacterium]|jgi:penicillin-binding protein 2